ncbi:uncharacterized protein LOC128768063 [Synchiropus splendidus]|uniref:uncharacterized protein LOC128768063 n=1 Tax=Synchiropus splendidus TaxID=270530 RepID=UPI00237E49C0|nr:uncharacterized protein LOC128768063 [Synchiropus splendidus]
MSQRLLPLLLVLLTSTGAAGDTFLFAQEGAEVTLSCDSRAPDQASCEGTAWLGDKDGGIETLAEHKTVKVDVDRLSLAPDCSLVIKKMGAGDARRYTCRQFDGPRPYTDADTFLSMVSLTRSMTQGDMTLTCKVIRPGFCPEKVQWLYQGQTITKDHPQLKTSSTTCGDAAVQFPLASFLERHFLTCEVSHRDTVKRFPFQAAVTSPLVTTASSPSSSSEAAPRGSSVVDYLVLTLRVAEVLLVTMVTVLLIKALRKRGSHDHSSRRRNTEGDGDEDVKYEN